METSDDANGNRVSKAAGGVTETYVVDDADKLTSITVGGSAVKTYLYDTAGRTTSVVTSAGTTSLTYDYESRVTQITFPTTATNTFTYNGLDTRVGKVDSAGTSTYKRDGDYVTAPVLEDGTAKFTPGVSDRRSRSSRFYHPDRLGSVLRHTSSSQGSTASRQYDAFGNVVSASGTFALPFGFAGNWGYQEDTDSGLKLLGHRYYDSSTGRFLTRDPIKDGRSWYAYCENNPLKAVDPAGLKVEIKRGLGWTEEEWTEVGEIICKIGHAKRGKELANDYNMTVIVDKIEGAGSKATKGRILIAPRQVGFLIGTEYGVEGATLKRIIAHELGHAIAGTKDDGDDSMNNIIINENPIVVELGLSRRLKY